MSFVLPQAVRAASGGETHDIALKVGESTTATFDYGSNARYWSLKGGDASIATGVLTKNEKTSITDATSTSADEQRATTTRTRLRDPMEGGKPEKAFYVIEVGM